MEKDVGTLKTKKHANKFWKVNIGPKIKQTTSIYLYISTALFILLYSGVSTYVGLYGSGLFNFRSYVNFPNFEVLTSLHLSRFLLKMFLLFLFPLFFSEW